MTILAESCDICLTAYNLIRTEIPARGDELTAAGGRATTEDALGRMRAYERGHAQTTEAPAATGSASVIDTNGWE